MNKQTYDNYKQSRNINNVSALDSYIISKKNDVLEAFINNHKKMLNEKNAVEDITKDITKDFIKDFESMIKQINR